MSNTVRIRTTPNGSDKYLKVKLEQDFDFVEILSLKISQEDAYIKFCSDYGAIVGRVTINNGFGIENAKVSVFIPLDDIDKNNPLIKGLYPYEVITDKDSDGIRYNVLPKISETDNPCYTPVGTFPAKREILDNDTMLEVYCKYYKFTTTTNYAGDFMIFGVPLGSYQVHVDADISDIGIVSQRPYDMISQGTPAKLFESPTKFKGGKNLDKLIQIKTLNAGVDVQPFWGDTENCIIGITRLDFDLNTTIIPAAIFMGSIYGDQNKHSINKHCRPRLKLGLTCEQVTGPGSVDMIRKTVDNKIEDFSVDGGRVIDDDGTWAFQVPMNLDYMITAEDGSMIASQDPNRGIPTRARVRFNIGMDETGGEGRLRTRARYLVPNNPQATGISDYTFGTDTDDRSFKDLYWNKIYTVSNYVSRFQRNTLISTRGFVGMKDVDACAGDKTPYPFNRVSTHLSPIFFIICLIIKIIGFIVYLINKIMVLINGIIDIINTIIGGIVNFIGSIVSTINSIPGVNIGNGPTWTNIDYIPCVTLKCPDDPSYYYAPGCEDDTSGFSVCSPTPNYYPGDAAGHNDSDSILCGFDKCMAFEMAKSLNLFQFDFYNDWINGTLFGFLLKYKKKSSKREVFCEYECSGSGTFTAIDGVDGNKNGVGDNDCQDNALLDTCYPLAGMADDADDQKEGKDSGTIRDGLIKKVGNEFFYAATTHNLSWNLFATDIVCLGSVFECDWQGIPYVRNLLIPTSYKIPPDEEELNSANQVEVTGMVNLGGTNQCGNFFNIDCVGLHVNDKMALNIRHICEMGVEIDTAIEDPTTGLVITPADCVISGLINTDIDDAGGKWFRDVFTTLNTSYTSANSFTIPSAGLATSFNDNPANVPPIGNGVYNFASSSDNGVDYINFRGYPLNVDSSYAQTKHSYFFYFGLLPGKTALDKMNERFFTQCNPVAKNDIIIQATTTVATGSTGSISFTFIGGTGPFNYTITGILASGLSYGPVTGTASGNPPSATITGLAAGTYTISATDSLGTPVTYTVVVTGQPPLYASVSKTKDSTTATSSDGEITISSAGGGIPPYTYNLYSAANALLSSGSLTAPKILGTLAEDKLIGYKVEVIDSVSTTLTFTGIKVGGPDVLTITPNSVVNATCYGSSNGSIHTTVTGGLGVVNSTTTAPGYSHTTTGSPVLTGLHAGTYVITSVAGSETATLTIVVSEPAQLAIKPYVLSEVQKQCDPVTYYVPFYIDNTGASLGAVPAGTFNYEYSIDAGIWIPASAIYNPTTALPIVISTSTPITVNLRIRFSLTQFGNLCTSNIVTIPASAIKLPSVALAMTNVTSTKQCTPNQADVSLSITRDLARGPLTMEYSINGGSWMPAGSTSLTLFNYTVSGLPSGGGTTTSNNLLFRATDIKGCQVTTSVNVIVPNAPLTCTVGPSTLVTSGTYTGQYSHIVSATGGIPFTTGAPYTGTGTFYTTSNTTYTATVMDSVLCTNTATG